MGSPFDIINALDQGKNRLKDGLAESEYVPYITNIHYSRFGDTILLANIMNQMHWLSNRMQHDFYLHTVRPKKRYKPWPKKDKMTTKNINAIMAHYKYSVAKARQALDVLSHEQIEEIIKQQEQ